VGVDKTEKPSYAEPGEEVEFKKTG